MSEDLSEGEKGDAVSDISTHGDSNRGRLPRISSVDAMDTWIGQQKGKKLYLVLIRHVLLYSVLCNSVHLKCHQRRKWSTPAFISSLMLLELDETNVATYAT